MSDEVECAVVGAGAAGLSAALVLGRARRRTVVSADDGRHFATALTDWVITDRRGAPTRVPDEFGNLFGSAVQTFTPGRVLLPATPDGAATREISVRASDVDPMAHVNNAAYIDEFDESLPPDVPGRLPRRRGAERPPRPRP